MCGLVKSHCAKAAAVAGKFNWIWTRFGGCALTWECIKNSFDVICYVSSYVLPLTFVHGRSFYWFFFFFFLMRQGKFSNTSCCQNRRRISSDHLLLPTVSFAWLLGALWKLLQLTELTEGKLNSFLPSWRLPWRVHSAVDWAEGMEWCEAGEGGTKPLCFRTLASWLHLNLQCGICRGEHSEARGSAAL